VRVREGSASCTDCEFNTNYLLPCRHILAVNIFRWHSARTFYPGQCHRRWWLDECSSLITSPSAASVIAPLSISPTSSDLLLTHDSSPLSLSKDGIFQAFMAAATRSVGFIQPHGEAGLAYAMSVLNQLDHTLAKGGAGVPPRYLKSPSTLPSQASADVQLSGTTGGGKRKRTPTVKVRDTVINLSTADGLSTVSHGKQSMRCTNSTSKDTSSSRRKKRKNSSLSQP